LRFIFTGPESCGKTTLAEASAAKWQGGLVFEYARLYLSLTGGKYSVDDLLHIGNQQHDHENLNAGQHQHIWCDTDIITVIIWSIEKFQSADRKLISLWEKTDKIDRFYFLCYPDIPWESDPLRENPHDRERLYNIYLQFLVKNQLPFKVLRGEFEEKMNDIEEIFMQHLS
jgi:nicotinamide riboside kinase